MSYYSNGPNTKHKPFPANSPPKSRRKTFFGDLTNEQKKTAEHWLAIFLKRWEGNLPNWRRAILVHDARFLATHVRDSAWGKRLFRAKATKRRNAKHGNPSPILKGEGWRLWDANKKAAKRRKEKALGIQPTRIKQGDLTGI